MLRVAFFSVLLLLAVAHDSEEKHHGSSESESSEDIEGKKGHCPAANALLCSTNCTFGSNCSDTVNCTSDVDCNGTQKCCNMGCGRKCVDPVSRRKTQT
ncbi:hypothetical protein GDO86_017886 [Hymenochirus boettgeri]|uniref:WAP domain-containing protein n=1 Tax=Hymenochirus boettgeri TaxID=247094 RepID=A0A8T2IIL2_9PIPI|nr:hypothetical protein GDO86_017886 [Hymenochirus boettgeri]